jgi:peptidoglycan/LPS O-acetylase OafA/YrhL
MAGNWALVLHGETRNTILAPLWSISVEEQFYVIWPTLFLLWRKRGVIFASLIILPIAWATDFILPAAHIPKHPQLWFNSFNQFQFFAIGGLLAILMHRRTLKLALSLRVAALVAALACFSLAAFPCHFQNPFVASKPLAIMGGYMAIDVGCVLFLIAFLDVKLPSLFNPLVYLGKISYGLYVFHMFILAAVSHLTETVLHLPYSLQLGLNWIITVLVVIPLAALSYEYFEKPFLRFKERFTFVNSRSV